MIENIIEWSVKNKLIVIIATVMIIIGGIYAMQHIPLDAIPDLSDVQVIIYTEYPGQAPQVMEDQVTYPLTTAMLSVPFAKVVRGYSFFGISFVYIIFEDGTDLYWARSRVLEYLNYVSGRLPAGITPNLGPMQPVLDGSMNMFSVTRQVNMTSNNSEVFKTGIFVMS